MRKHVRALYALAALSIIGLMVFIRNYPISNFDFYVTHELQKITVGNFSSLMTFVSVFGNSGMMPGSVIFVSLVFFVTHYHREARFILVVLVADTLNVLVKLLVHRPRPTLEDAMIMLKFDHASFPSGHVVHYVVLFGFLIAVMVVNSKIRMLYRVLIGMCSAFLIVSVSVSRIYLGAHWATDVLGAYVFGCIYLGGILTLYFQDRIKHHGRDPEKNVHINVAS